MLCCLCNKRKATAFLSQIVGKQTKKLNVCIKCYKLENAKSDKPVNPQLPTNLMATTTFSKKTLGLETTEPAVTPPSHGETTFVKKPKLGGGKSKKKEIPEGLWTKCKKCST